MGQHPARTGQTDARAKICAVMTVIALMTTAVPSTALGDELNETDPVEGVASESSELSAESLAKDLPDYHPSEYFTPSNDERITFDLYDYQINHITIKIDRPSLVSFSMSQFCEISGDNYAVSFSFNDRAGEYICNYGLTGNNPSEYVQPTFFEPGTYTIDVLSLGEAYFGRSVSFRYTATPISDCYDLEDNDSFEEARNVPLNTKCTGTIADIFAGSFNLDFDGDYYKINIPTACEVWISTTCFGDLSVDLFGSDEKWVYSPQGRPVFGYTSESSPTTELYAGILQPGTYYLDFFGIDSVWGKQYQFTVTANEVPVPVAGFSDVMSNDWFASAVEFASENGLMNGYDNGCFGPNDPFSRAQVAMVMWNSAGKVEATGDDPFSDVSPSDWFGPAVAWAYENNVITGYDGTDRFGPNDSVSREQFATILWRYCGSPTSTHSLDSFPDSASISDYATTAMQWAVENKIINGQDGFLNPQGTATRAMAATILMNWKNNVEQ